MTHPPQPRETSSSPAVVLSYPQAATTVSTVTGTIDANTTPPLSAILTEAARDENPHLVLDLSTITFLDSTGLKALFAVSHYHDISSDGHLAAVIDSNTRAIPQIYLVALEMVFDVHTNLYEALHACTRRTTLTGTTERSPNHTEDCLTQSQRRVVAAAPE